MTDSLPPAAKEYEAQLRKLVDVFLRENAKVNLSALRSPEQCWVGNVLDSLAALDIEPIHRYTHTPIHLLDLGTGGGFPLLPLAICLPQAQCTGLDATQKKTDAVERIARALGLGNVELLAGRAETLGRDGRYREQFDIATARAVAPVRTLLEYCAAFVKVNGRIILWKSLDIAKELEDSLRARTEFSCRLTGEHRYTLPGDFGERQLLVFEKTAALSKKYPRTVGVPKKSPLR